MQFFSLLPLLLASFALSKADETVTSHTTKNYVAVATVTEYVWTNTDGKLTTTAITGKESYVPASEWPASLETTVLSSPYSPSSSAYPVSSFNTGNIVAAASATPSSSSAISSETPAPSSSPSPTSTSFSIPSGEYSTSTSYTTTEVSPGSTAIVEYVVLFTNTCQGASTSS